MQFVNPYFLFAVIAAAIPIVIHLFNFRRFRVVYFSNVALLQHIQQDTKKTSQLKHLLVLLSRILAILSMVFAFAQPFIPADDSKKIMKGTQSAVSIYIDNSFSMDANAEESTLLHLAKVKAREIVDAYRPGDQFQLLTNDFHGKHQVFLSKEEFLDEIESVVSSPVVRSVSEVVKRQKDLLATSNSKDKALYLISDMQKNMMDLKQIEEDSLVSIFLIPLERVALTNLTVDSVWMDNPVIMLNTPAAVHVRIRNNSEKEFDNVPVKLYINNQQKATTPMSVQPGDQEEFTMQFTVQKAGVQLCYIEIEDYPVLFDNKLFFSFNVHSSIPVLEIYSSAPNKYIHNLFEGDSIVTLTSVPISTISMNQIDANNVILFSDIKRMSAGLAQELAKKTIEGKTLIIAPSSDPIDLSLVDFYKQFGVMWNINADTVNTQVDRIDDVHPLYRNVFTKKSKKIHFPAVYMHYPVKANSGNTSVLMQVQNNDPILLVTQVGMGAVYTFSTPLQPEFSELVEHSLFIPTTYQMVLQSMHQAALYSTIGVDQTLSFNHQAYAGDNALRMELTGSDFNFVPAIHKENETNRIFVADQLKMAGNYKLLNEGADIGAFSFNYDRRESKAELISSEELGGLVNEAGRSDIKLVESDNKDLKIYLQELNQGLQLWKYFVILALFFLFIEILLLRFLKI